MSLKTCTQQAGITHAAKVHAQSLRGLLSALSMALPPAEKSPVCVHTRVPSLHVTPCSRPSPCPLLAAALPGMPSVCSRWHLLSVLGPLRARGPPVPPPPPCLGLCRWAGPCDPQGGLLTAQRQSLGVSAGALTPPGPATCTSCASTMAVCLGCSLGVRLSRLGPAGGVVRMYVCTTGLSFHRFSESPTSEACGARVLAAGRLTAMGRRPWPPCLSGSTGSIPLCPSPQRSITRHIGQWCESHCLLSRKVSTTTTSRSSKTAWGCQALSRLRARGCELAVTCPWRGQALSREKGTHRVYGFLSASVLFAVRTGCE